MPVEEALKRGYKLPFYADLTSMPETERRVIWGMMVGNEGKTRTPVYKAYNDAGFDPSRDALQSYGDGWRSGQFLPQERQFFGIPGGMVNDWRLMTNLEGLFAAGDVLFASDCVGHAAATGHYAGRHAADYAASHGPVSIHQPQVDAERARLFEPLQRQKGLSWQALAEAITRVMQNYCGAVKSDDLLHEGLRGLEDLKEESKALVARNPHDLLRAQETLNVLTNAELVIHSCLARKASSHQLQFTRLDYPEHGPARVAQVRHGVEGRERRAERRAADRLLRRPHRRTTSGTTPTTSRERAHEQGDGRSGSGAGRSDHDLPGHLHRLQPVPARLPGGPVPAERGEGRPAAGALARRVLVRGQLRGHLPRARRHRPEPPAGHARQLEAAGRVPAAATRSRG